MCDIPSKIYIKLIDYVKTQYRKVNCQWQLQKLKYKKFHDGIRKIANFQTLPLTVCATLRVAAEKRKSFR